MNRRTIITAAALSLTALAVPAAAEAGTAPTRIVAHFDLAAGQMPENVVLDRAGGVAVTFAASRQVARVSAGGAVTVLATLPAPADPSAAAPVLGFPLITGLVRDGRTYYVAYASGSGAETGIWRFTEGGVPRRLAALPGDGLPNGLAQDPRTGTLYVTDSVRGAVYEVSRQGRVTTFSTDPALAPATLLGANGAKIHDNALYVSNLDRGTVLRFPLRAASRPTTVATGLTGIDDFTFTGRGDDFVAALISTSEVVHVHHNRGTVLLTAADGLSNPTSVALRGRSLFVPSAAYLTQSDPNLLVTTLRH